jgi:hypothetical protein
VCLRDISSSPHSTFNHQAEFCYLCEARWKTCACTQWDETRLVAAAQERVLFQQHIEAARRPAPVLARWNRGQCRNGNRAAPPPVGPNEQELIQALVNELRVNHDCQHERWRYRDGGGQCVGCRDVLDRYVFVSGHARTAIALVNLNLFSF